MPDPLPLDGDDLNDAKLDAKLDAIADAKATDDDSLDLLPVEPPRAKPTARAAPLMPESTGPNSDPLVDRLRRDDDAVAAGGMTSVAGGAAIIVLASFAIGLLLAGLCWLWTDSTGLGIFGWSFVLLLIFAGLVAWLLRPSPPAPDAGRYVAGAPPELLERGPLDWPLLGPRLLVQGIRLAQGNEPVARGYFYDRCALLLRMLGKRGEQAPIAAMLISDDETPLMLGRVIKYLDRTGWVGASSDKTRVWLSTKGRQVLMDMGVVPDNEIVRGA